MKSGEHRQDLELLFYRVSCASRLLIIVMSLYRTCPQLRTIQSEPIFEYGVLTLTSFFVDVSYLVMSFSECPCSIHYSTNLLTSMLFVAF